MKGLKGFEACRAMGASIVTAAVATMSTRTTTATIDSIDAFRSSTVCLESTFVVKPTWRVDTSSGGELESKLRWWENVR